MKNVTKLKSTYKLSQAIFIILRFMTEAFIAHVFFSLLKKSQKDSLTWKTKLIQKNAIAMLKVLNIELSLNNNFITPKQGLIVCNHLSYIDIVVMGSVIPSLFITSVETGQAGWIGFVCKLAGCMFVERRKAMRTESDFKNIDECLKLNIPIVLYPEATSTSGSKVLPFKSTLYQCAIRTGLPIHTFCIYYEDENQAIPYHSDMTLPSHLANLCTQNKMTAHLHFLESIQTTSVSDRKLIAEQTHHLVSEAYVHRVC